LFNDPDPEFFGTFVSYLGLAENPKKRKDGWIIDFTGIELDSNSMVARLLKDKHDRAIAGVQRLLTAGAVIVRSKNFSDSFHFVQKLFPSEDPFYAISSISFNDYHTYTQMQ